MNETVISTYQDEFDQQLIELFYKSNFYNKREFDYVRIPNNWIDRYNSSEDFITKIMISNKKVICSIGLLVRNVEIKGKKIKVGCFVDKCVLPEFHDKQDILFSELITHLEREAISQEIKLIYGWEYLDNYTSRNTLRKIGYCEIDGFNWISSAILLHSRKPYFWEVQVPFWWKLFFKIMELNQNIKERYTNKLPDGIEIINFEINDLDDVHELIKNNLDYELKSFYSKDDIKKFFPMRNYYALVVKKDKKIIGFLSYFLSAWSGWMFGKPMYSNKWSVFYGITPDEFYLSDEFKKINITENLFKKLMYVSLPTENTSNNLNFVASIFDSKIINVKHSLFNLGFAEPKFDKGCLLYKKLDSNLDLDTNKPWQLPSRFIISPVDFV